MIFGSLSLFLFLGLCILYSISFVLSSSVVYSTVGCFSFFGVLGLSLFFADLLVFDMYRCHLALFLCSCCGGFVPVSVLAGGSFGRLLVGFGVFFADFLCFLGLYRCFGFVSDLKEGWDFGLGTCWCTGCCVFCF